MADVTFLKKTAPLWFAVRATSTGLYGGCVAGTLDRAQSFGIGMKCPQRIEWGSGNHTSPNAGVSQEPIMPNQNVHKFANAGSPASHALECHAA